MPVGQKPVVSGPEHKTDTQGRASLSVWSAQYQGFDQRQLRTEHKGHTTNPGQKLKFLTSPGIETGTPGSKAGTLPTTPRRRMSLKAQFIKSFNYRKISYLRNSRNEP